ASGRILERPIRPEEVAFRFPCLPVRILANGAVDVSQLCSSAPNPPLIVDAAGEPADAEPDVPAFPKQGTWVSQPLDSEISRCVWHRVVFSGILAPRTAVEVYSLTAESN